jgi:hypothetical protein
MAQVDKSAQVPDDDYELITTASGFGSAPKLRTEEVKLPEIRKRVFVSQLTSKDFSDLQDTNRVYSKSGEHVGWDYSNEDIKLLTFTLRDREVGGNRIFQTVAATVSALEEWPLQIIRRLVDASNRVSAADPVSAEKNSEETSKNSSPSSSA